VVSDSFDVFGFVKMATEDKDIRNLIMNRDGKVVFRPDSGDPVEVNRKLLSILEKGFGVTVNSKGYKELPSYVGIIQGDGIDRDMVNKLLDMLEEEGFAATTLVYGSGGGLLQKFNRDTQKFAIKCSHLIANGIERDVQKDPVTAPGKKSKTGYLSLVKIDGKYLTLQEGKTLLGAKDELVTVFENGELLIEYSLETIRANAQIKESEIKLQEKVELV
jgi:nicotinamide phosphoribosyltransferase